MDLSRFALLIGEDGIELLGQTTVDIFGLGGVGGHAMEALVRAGIGILRLYDFDTVEPSNINRQIIATRETMGMRKTDAAEKRCRAINEKIIIGTSNEKITAANVSSIVPLDCRYAIDAIDDVKAKAALLANLYHLEARFLTSMGSGNRLDPFGINFMDISETSGCPLARAVRKELRSSGIVNGVTCLISTSPALAHKTKSSAAIGDRSIGSSSFTPAIFGLTLASRLVTMILSDAGIKPGAD